MELWKIGLSEISQIVVTGTLPQPMAPLILQKDPLGAMTPSLRTPALDNNKNSFLFSRDELCIKRRSL